jgi:hypothetical protein
LLFFDVNSSPTGGATREKIVDDFRVTWEADKTLTWEADKTRQLTPMGNMDDRMSHCATNETHLHIVLS